jgi:hypothetical protein
MDAGLVRQDGPRQRPTLVIFLSLFLILLAFFLVLVSHSQAEQSRVAAALGSVGRALRGGPDIAFGFAGAADPEAAAEAAGRFQARVKQGFVGDLPELAFVAAADGTVLQVPVPLGRLFAGDRLLAEREPLLGAIAGALKTAEGGVRHQVEVALPAEPASRALAIARAGALARDLEARGVDGAAIAVGIDATVATDTALLTFASRPERPPGRTGAAR